MSSTEMEKKRRLLQFKLIEFEHLQLRLKTLRAVLIGEDLSGVDWSEVFDNAQEYETFLSILLEGYEEKRKTVIESVQRCTRIKIRDDADKFELVSNYYLKLPKVIGSDDNFLVRFKVFFDELEKAELLDRSGGCWKFKTVGVAGYVASQLPSGGYAFIERMTNRTAKKKLYDDYQQRLKNHGNVRYQEKVDWCYTEFLRSKGL